MASHSRPPRPRVTVSRAACTLALASAASVSLFGETGNAQPRLTPEEVKAKVQTLYQEAERATEQYDGAKQQADAAQKALNGLQDELARKAAALNATRDALGTVAAAQYRSGSLDPSLQLVLSSSPQAYLEQAGMLDQLGNRQSAALDRLIAQQRGMAQTRAEAAGRLDALRAAQSRLAARKQTVQRTLAAAQALLAQLSPADRAAVNAADGPDQNSASAANRSTVRPPLTVAAGAPSARAAQAVAFAYRALGLPYVWGATGPNAYDCSGLTQAAWRSAGVALPRTTYTQINAGTRVPESGLLPGDLVFFYSGVSHVGIYIGGGQMIHAPHPGAPVRIAPVSEMPFAGATRPG
ncbi:C40 family peptidase [Actinacidiphila rubida]|uniref:Cell wall-associated hydrolase, NlpC family n=1 Tax=Actinacidiphila rubida TaxID=310780 RepID=A0A1H8ML81_9ACTN|nr:C40 family peptidase [Actinacidiphila rubida]SEO18040.1 Cell wall-associated hydrolase, NlpC family [Actinacidiphila rubida]